MLYLVIDLTTGETVDKAANADSAERKCAWLDDVHQWVDGHVYGYVLSPEGVGYDHA